MNRTGKHLLTYIIAVIIITCVFAGYRQITGSKKTYNNGSNNDTYTEGKANEDSQKSQKGKEMVNLALNNLSQAFLSPVHVKQYYDDLVKQGLIDRYEFNSGEDTIVLVYEKNNMQSFSDYYKNAIDEALDKEYDKYYFELGTDYSNLTLFIYPETDGAAAFRDLGKIYYFIETYKYSCLAENFKLHVVIKRADTGNVLGELDMPGGSIDISAEDWTGIDDHDKAMEMLNASAYSYIGYTFPTIEEGKYYCNAGGYCFTIPEGTEFTSEEVNNTLNKLDNSKDLVAVKKKISQETAYMESNLVFDDSTFVMMGVNYFEGLDEAGFSDYINEIYVPDLDGRDGVTVNGVSEVEFAGRKAICINYVDGDKNCKHVTFFKDGLIYSISGTYKEKVSEKVIDDFLASVLSIE